MTLKLKRTPGIYLVGFMGSGKSTIGALLADELGWLFADTDEDIEKTEGASISDIFRTLGEPRFREIEAGAIQARVRAVRSGRPSVIALGGGAFAQPDNFELIQNNGVSIWLDCPFEQIQKRIAGTDHRPLARDPEAFAQLYQHRKSAYEQADYRIAITSDEPVPVVQAILGLPLF